MDVLAPVPAGKLLDQVASRRVRPETLLTGKLTARRGDVLRLIARGLNNPEIAARLHLSEGTARNHIRAILFKLEGILIPAFELGKDRRSPA